MTTEDENNMTPTTSWKPIRKPHAHNVFDMLTAHAELYQNVITRVKVQQDIYATFGVWKGRNAVIELLRDIAAKGLITRDIAKGRGWYFFHSMPAAEMTDVAEDRIRDYISKTAEPVKRTRSLLRAKPGNREASESVKAFIQASKKEDCELVFTKDAVLSFLRVNGMAVLPGRSIVKVIGNMIVQKRGVVKTDRKAVYCVLADEMRFGKSAVQSKEFEVRRPDVVTPDNARQTDTQKDEDLEHVCQAVAAVALAFRAVSRLSGLRDLSGLISTFKE